MGIALGIGLTNECNLSCEFCYRDPDRVDRLHLDQVEAVIARLAPQSVNLGTGENGMHPEFGRILEYLRRQPLKLTITSNGRSIEMLDDQELRAFHDVEFSLDYPNLEEQDGQRGPGNWDLIHRQAVRCVQLGVPVTVVSVMMKSNFDRLGEVARVAAQWQAPLRVNVYQSVRSDRYALSYDEYWTGFRKLFAQTEIISIGETLVRAFAGLDPLRPDQARCGAGTVRVTPRGTVQACVYTGPSVPLKTLLDVGSAIQDIEPFREIRGIPPPCRECAFVSVCQGGCAGRRKLHGRPNEPDPYCPIVRGDHPQIDVRVASSRDLPKAGSACTTIVQCAP